MEKGSASPSVKKHQTVVPLHGVSKGARCSGRSCSVKRGRKRLPVTSAWILLVLGWNFMSLEDIAPSEAGFACVPLYLSGYVTTLL